MTATPPATGAGFIALEGGDARVEVIPTEQGRISSLHLFGREWLESDGWAEELPSAPPPRTAIPEATLSTDAEGHRLRCQWEGRGEGWMLARTLLVRPDGAVDVRYEARTGPRLAAAIPWELTFHFPLGPRTQLLLPADAPTAASQPWSLPAKELMVWEHTLPRGRVPLELREEGDRLTFQCDGSEISTLKLVIQRGSQRRLPWSSAVRPSLALSLGRLLKPGAGASSPIRWGFVLRATP